MIPRHPPVSIPGTPAALRDIRELCSNSPMFASLPGRLFAAGHRHPRPGLGLLLALLLVLAQFAAAAHGLSHVSDHPDEGGAHGAACEWCLTLSPLGAAVPAAGLCLPARDGTSPRFEAGGAAAAAAPLPYRYHSRAPPPA